MAEPELVKKWIRKADEDFGYASPSLKEDFMSKPDILLYGKANIQERIL